MVKLQIKVVKKNKEILTKKLPIENWDLGEKLWNLEDRLHCDNLRFNGIKKYDQESWVDTEEALKGFLSEELCMRGIGIGRANRVGRKDIDNYMTKTIVAKLR